MNVNSPSVSACMAVCMDKPKCVYFTYLTKGKKCFLKKAGVGQKNMQGAIGGDCSNVLTVQTTAAVETVPPEYLSGEGVRWLEYPRAPAKVQETVSVLVNGVVYSWGEGEPTTLAFDTHRYSWIYDKPLAVRKYVAGHHAVAAVGSTVVLIGGVQRTSTNTAGVKFSKIVQLYNPQANRWKTAAPYPHGPAASIQAVTIGESVYACGGLTGSGVVPYCAKYSAAANKWTTFKSMPYAVHHGAAGTDGKNMYIFGGRDNNANKVSDGTRLIQVYDTKTKRWTKLPVKMPFKLAGMGAAPFVNGEFWLMGGETKTQYELATKDKVFDKVQSFNPGTMQWTTRPNMPHGVHGMFPVADPEKKCIYVVGGGLQAGLFKATDAMQVLYLK